MLTWEAVQRLQAPEPVQGLTVMAVAGSWGLFKQSVHLLFDGVPEGVDTHAMRRFLAGLPGVTQVPDLHVWAMGTADNALTAHLVMPAGPPGDAFLQHAV